MLTAFILQVETLPTGFWDQVFSQTPIVVLLILAVIWLGKRDQNRDEKLDKYIAEDRKEMLLTIQNNTSAMQEMTEMMKERMNVDRELQMFLQHLNKS